MNRVYLQATALQINEVQPNDVYMSIQMRMFSTRANQNGYAVSEAFIDQIIENAAKYTCLPQCADAEKLRRGETKGLGHMLHAGSGTFESEQIGSFFSFSKVHDEFGVSLIGEARIPKRHPVLCETILSMYRTGALNFSFEIQVGNVIEENGTMVIEAAECNEQIGMAVVSTPAYPEAKALALVAENETRKDDIKMDENQKRIAELEAKLQLAEQRSESDEELRKKDEELEESEKKREQAEAELKKATESIAEKETRIAELETQIKELSPFKAEAETLRQEKAAAELAAKQRELTAFAEAQGLDLTNEAIAGAIREVNYAALIDESIKMAKKKDAAPAMASYAMTKGMAVAGEYGDLLEKA